MGSLLCLSIRQTNSPRFVGFVHERLFSVAVIPNGIWKKSGTRAPDLEIGLGPLALRSFVESATVTHVHVRVCSCERGQWFELL